MNGMHHPCFGTAPSQYAIAAEVFAGDSRPSASRDRVMFPDALLGTSEQASANMVGVITD